MIGEMGLGWGYPEVGHSWRWVEEFVKEQAKTHAPGSAPARDRLSLPQDLVGYGSAYLAM